MTDLTAWNRFLKTGSVMDYLSYRRPTEPEKEQVRVEIHDRRTDNKRE